MALSEAIPIVMPDRAPVFRPAAYNRERLYALRPHAIPM
jgi:hypothetical protein